MTENNADLVRREHTILNVLAAIEFGLVAIFFSLNQYYGPKYEKIFNDLRVDLPLTTRLTLLIIRLGPAVALVLPGLFAFALYLRSRRFIVLFILFLSVTLCLESLSIYMPFQKLQEALRKL